MNDFLTQVLPGTRALIWLPKQEIEPQSHNYRRIDYLCDGILTSSLKSLEDKNSVVLLANNFGSSFMIFVSKKLVAKELESFLGLIPKDKNGEILVIDEAETLPELARMVPKELSPVLKKIH